MRICFHLDEHISSQIAAGLRRRNIDVTTTAEAGLIGASDLMQIEFAASSGRVFVTHDADFLRLNAEGMTHPGIAYGEQQSTTVGIMLRRLILVHDVLSPADMNGRVEFV